MHRKNFYYATLIVSITAVLTVAITLKLSRSRSATPVQPASTAQLVARASTPADEYRGAQKEGIKVHGHWTIDVRNPDGTLATHREFENSLSVLGPSLLTRLLARQAAAGLWAIELQLYNGTSFVAYLEIQEPGDDIIHFPSGPMLLFKTLTVSPAPPPALPPFPTPTSLTLSGYTTPLTQGGTTREVATLNRNCRGGAITAAQCASDPEASPQEFTRTATPPLTVVAGQIIQVTVVISFS